MANKDFIKYGLIIGGGGLAAWGLTKLANFKDTADKLTFNITRLNVGNKGLEYITLVLDLEFVNPSNQTISLNLPSIKPYYGESELGYSVPMTSTKVIAPNSISKITNVEIRIPTQNLITSGLLVDVLTINLSQLTETLKQKILFKIFAVVNGLEVTIEQRFGDEAKELGYIDEVSGIFEGLGLVAAGKRKIKDGSEYDYLFPNPKGVNERVQNDGDVNDTVLWCGYVVKTYHADTEKLAEFLQNKSKSQKDLFRNIFDFCYNHIQYHLDRPGVEELRRPAVTWKDRKFGVDCDDFTMFVASILFNLNIPFEFRITKYNRPNYQHIYLIVPVEKDVHITIDPVLDTFNYEKPFSQKKDYDMKALNLAGTDKNIGIPIEILAGNKFDNDLLKIAFGEDLQGVLNGLGSTEDDEAAMLRHLKRLRNTYVKHPDYIADFQDPKQAVEMLDYAIKYWNTPKRQEAIDRLAQIEDELIAKGEIKLAGFDDDDEDWEDDTDFTGVEPELAGFEYKYFGGTDEWEDDIEFSGTEPELSGYEYQYEEPDWEEDFGFTGDEIEAPDYEYDYSIDGLAGKRRRKRKAKRAAKRSRRKAKRKTRRAKRKAKGGLFKRVGAGLKKGIKKVARGVMKVSAAPMRLAFLAAMRANAGKVSDKLKYAYLTEQKAVAMGIDRNEYRKLKKAHAKVENMFYKMGGNKSALKRAILSGKRKNLRGFEELNGGISGIDELDGFELDLGFTGSKPEDPDNEYKYDNQVWDVDENFSGVEPEESEFNYDYSFDGLDGRRMRFRKRKKAKRRYKRSRKAPRRAVRNTRVHDPFKKVVSWLKDIDIKKLSSRNRRKQDFLKAISNNHNNVSHILAYGYKNQKQAQSAGIDTAQWQKIKSALQKTRQLFTKEFGGREAELKKAILLGENKPNLEGLGVAVAAASAAAGLIGKIVGWIKNIKLKKQARKQAKTSFTESGGTAKDWRQTGKKQFSDQWDTQVQTKQTTDNSQPNTDFSDLIANQLKSGTSNNQTIPEMPTQNFTSSGNFQSGTNKSLITQASYTPGGETVKQSAFKAFLNKHKKKLLIGGGIIGAGVLAYAFLKPKDKPTPKKVAAQRNNGVSGTQTRKKKTTKAKPGSNSKKIIEVKLN